jgi:hypothetical protein
MIWTMTAFAWQTEFYQVSYAKQQKEKGLTLCSRCTSPTVRTPGLDHGVAEHTAECPLKPPATNLLIKYTIPGHSLPCNPDPQSASCPQQSHGS